MNDQWGSRRGSQESRALQRPRHTEIPALRLLPLPGSVFAAIGHEASPNGAGEGEEQQRQLGRRTPPSAPLEDLPEAPVVTPEQRHAGKLSLRRLGAKPGRGCCTGPRPALPGLGRAGGIKNPKEQVPRSTGAIEAQAAPGEISFPSGSPAVPWGAGDAAREEAKR